eukprot:gene19120-biopygen16027
MNTENRRPGQARTGPTRSDLIQTTWPGQDQSDPVPAWQHQKVPPPPPPGRRAQRPGRGEWPEQRWSQPWPESEEQWADRLGDWEWGAWEWGAWECGVGKPTTPPLLHSPPRHPPPIPGGKLGFYTPKSMENQQHPCKM